MIFNAGYMTGIGGIEENISKVHRHIFPCHRQKNRFSEILTRALEEIRPDIVFLAEIRDEPHLQVIKNFFAQNHIDSKYKEGFVSRIIPFFRGNCNGVFLSEHYPVRKLFLKNGTKKLVYRIDIAEDISLYFSHFALSKKARKKQFEEMARMLAETPDKKVVVAGDFNVFYGFSELEDLMSEANLRIASDLHEHTFPRTNPTRAIDLFLASPELKIEKEKVLRNVALSDHLPVVLDLQCA